MLNGILLIRNDKEDNLRRHNDFANKPGLKKKKMKLVILGSCLPLCKSIDITINSAHIKVNSLPT